MQHFLTVETLIIGAGQAAIPLAFDLAKAGQRVAIAERRHLGGSCVNFGCTPTKTALAAAKLAFEARRANEFGLKISSVEVDFPVVLEAARAVAEESRLGLEEDFEEGGNPVILRGHALLTGKKGRSFVASVGDQTVHAATVVLDTGTRSAMPPIPGLDEIDPIHAGNWLDRKVLPKRMVILGGGPIGLEMSQFYARMGCNVTILESGPSLGGHEDPDVARALEDVLEKELIVIRTGTRVKAIKKVEGGYEFGCDTCVFEGDAIFVALGRKPNTDDLGLETVGVEVDDKGIVKVDEHLCTTSKGIYAVGDIRGGYQFTHTSWDDYRIVLSQLVGDKKDSTRRVVPYAIFTDPQLGHVGLSETEAKEKGFAFKVHSYDMVHNGMARETHQKLGFVKVLVEEETDRVLGAVCLAAQGAEMIQVFALMMEAKVTASAFRRCVVAHPTFMEAAQGALL